MIDKEEAIARFEEWAKCNYEPTRQAAQMALAALRPISRERVERATWIVTTDNGCTMYACSACGARDVKELYEYENPRLFCYRCGRPMTDEAVDIVLRRLEALHETK